MAENWVVDPTADPAYLQEIVPETSGTKLGTWIGVIRNIAAFDNRERLKQLTVPTLVIWATQGQFLPGSGAVGRTHGASVYAPNIEGGCRRREPEQSQEVRGERRWRGNGVE